MKRFLCFLLVFVALSLPALAEGETDEANLIYVDGVGYMTYEEYLTYMPKDTPYETASPASESPEIVQSELPGTSDPDGSELDFPSSGVDGAQEWVLTGVSVYSSLSPVEPSDANGLKAVMLTLLGNYDPIVAEYQYQNSNQQYYSYLREIQPDYPWLISAAIFLVIVYCLFKAGGAALCRR